MAEAGRSRESGLVCQYPVYGYPTLRPTPRHRYRLPLSQRPEACPRYGTVGDQVHGAVSQVILPRGQRHGAGHRSQRHRPLDLPGVAEADFAMSCFDRLSIPSRIGP